MAKGKKVTKAGSKKTKTGSKKTKAGSKKTKAGSKKTTSKKVSKKEPTPPEEPSGPVVADFMDVLDELDEMRKQITSIKHRFQDLGKYASQLEKKVNKAEKKKAERQAKKDGKPRARGGIMKKAPVSDELCKFLKIDKGSEMTRNEVRNQINTYAKDNDLKEGTLITLDKDLSSLFPDIEGDTLAYNAIIGQLRPHFPQVESSS